VLFTNSDRLFFLQLYRWFPSIVNDNHPARDAGAMASRRAAIGAGDPATWEAGHQSMRVYGP
jgi:hypothetical protein